MKSKIKEKVDKLSQSSWIIKFLFKKTVDRSFEQLNATIASIEELSIWNKYLTPSKIKEPRKWNKYLTATKEEQKQKCPETGIQFYNSLFINAQIVLKDGEIYFKKDDGKLETTLQRARILLSGMKVTSAKAPADKVDSVNGNSSNNTESSGSSSSDNDEASSPRTQSDIPPEKIIEQIEYILARLDPNKNTATNTATENSIIDYMTAIEKEMKK